MQNRMQRIKIIAGRIAEQQLEADKLKTNMVSMDQFEKWLFVVAKVNSSFDELMKC